MLSRTRRIVHIDSTHVRSEMARLARLTGHSMLAATISLIRVARWQGRDGDSASLPLFLLIGIAQQDIDGTRSTIVPGGRTEGQNLIVEA